MTNILQVVEVSELPLLVNGKIDRQKLLSLFEDQKRGKFYTTETLN